MNHGDHVSVYDRNGNFECRGKIVGRYGLNIDRYDIQPDKQFSLASRICGIPAARVRKVGIPELVINEDR